MNETYEIVDNGLGIKCLKCGHTSYDFGDIDSLWCSTCKKFHEDMMAEDNPPKLAPPKPLPGRGPVRKEGWKAVCVGARRVVPVGRNRRPGR